MFSFRRYHQYMFIPASLFTLFILASIIGQPVVQESQANVSRKRSIQQLKKGFNKGCFVAYSPSTFDPVSSPPKFASEPEIRNDLRLLNDAGFDGLVTYSSLFANPEQKNEPLNISDIAKEEGFQYLIMGIWDPASPEELAAAEKASVNSIVLGYSVGNEGLHENSRYGMEVLRSTMQQLRDSTGLPVTTTEQAHDYLEDPLLYEISDWIFPTLHPYFAGIPNPENAVDFTEKIYQELRSKTSRPVILKEVGLPSQDGSVNTSETMQASYYSALKETKVNFVYFEGYDQVWKHINYKGFDPEPHWGLFTTKREPKQVVDKVCK